MCTGPLGQGISNAVGMAMAERHMAATFNSPEYPIFDNYTFVICGDGCLQEGISSEASSLAGHLGLGKLIVLYDDNGITIDGDTKLSFTEDVLKRYEAYEWHVQTVSDVTTSLDDLRNAIKEAKSVTDKPSMIKVKTAIGYGSPSKEGKEEAHGSPLGAEDLAGAKEFYGLPRDKSFYVSDEVQQVFTAVGRDGDNHRRQWEKMFAAYASACPDKAAELSRRLANKLPDGIFDKLPKFQFGKDSDKATRQFSEMCLTALYPIMPELVGGSADLAPSNLTRVKDAVDFQRDSPEGRYFRFGVREHGMVAITNGIFAYGGLRPFCATFLTFAGYCMGAIRLSCLSRFGVIFVMTHDSIGLGEDGPTHQPIETLEGLRAMININVFRPADCNETVAAYQSALTTVETPTVICCSRSTVTSLQGSTVEKALKGAYIAVEVEHPALILISTGSEVGFCVSAAKTLTDSGVATRVVSMPCQEVFLEQKLEYQHSVLPGDIPTLSVEAASVNGWARFSHAQIGMTTYGLSGNGSAVFKYFGFSPENIVKRGKELVEFYKKNGPVPNLNHRPDFTHIINTGMHLRITATERK